MPQVLLIDDETSARADLREKLASHSDVAIVGEAATLGAARALLLSADYQLVFLDVELVGGESFKLLSEVRPGASIVFATAHERYAVRAFESGAVDYLLKPIDPARLAEALRRAAIARAANVPRRELAGPDWPARPEPPLARLAFNRLPPIPEEFSEVVLTADECVFLRQCLEAWEDSLAPTHVLRAQHARTGRFPREVRYSRDTEPTRFFLSGRPVSCARRWWRAVCARFAA